MNSSSAASPARAAPQSCKQFVNPPQAAKSCPTIGTVWLSASLGKLGGQAGSVGWGPAPPPAARRPPPAARRPAAPPPRRPVAPSPRRPAAPPGPPAPPADPQASGRLPVEQGEGGDRAQRPAAHRKHRGVVRTGQGDAHRLAGGRRAQVGQLEAERHDRTGLTDPHANHSARRARPPARRASAPRSPSRGIGQVAVIRGRAR